MSLNLKEAEAALKTEAAKVTERIRSECDKQYADKLASLKMQHQQELNDIASQSNHHIESMKREYEQRIQDLMHQL